jgi:hypothetical protein
MSKTQAQRLGIFLGLALTMAITRIHLSLFHHDVRDASWAVFFFGGFWLAGQWRWAFPLLIAEAVGVDYLVISGQGISFWSHYCLSPAYVFLLPAYGSLWLGGRWLARHRPAAPMPALAMAAAVLLASVSVCYLISNGSFYWLSASVPAPRSMNAWLANLGDWYLPFLETTALYAAIGALLHGLVVQLTRASNRHATTRRVR